MKFSPTFLDEIRARVSISSVVGRRVAWDRRKSNPGRGDLWACCPFHNEKTPSFHVEDRKGRYHCFGCKASGDIFTFMVEKDGAELSGSRRAIGGRKRDCRCPPRRPRMRRARSSAPRSTTSWKWRPSSSRPNCRPRAVPGRAAIFPIAGFPIAVQREFRIGYAPDDKSALRSHLAAKSVTLEQMVDAGLVITGDDIPVAYDRFRDRIIFPIRDGRGRVVAFGGRALSKDALAKYLNSPETPLFHKGRMLYNHGQGAGARARGRPHHRGRRLYGRDRHASRRPYLLRGAARHCTHGDQLGSVCGGSRPSPCSASTAMRRASRPPIGRSTWLLPLLTPGHSLRLRAPARRPGSGRSPEKRRRGSGARRGRPGRARSPISCGRANSRKAGSIRRTAARCSKRALSSLIAQIGDDTVRKYYAEEFKRRLAQQLAPAGAQNTLFPPGGKFQPAHRAVRHPGPARVPGASPCPMISWAGRAKRLRGSALAAPGLRAEIRS